MNVQIAHIKKECAKNNKCRILYEPFNPFFIEKKKKHFFHKKDKKSIKLWVIHSEGTFSEIKEIQEFKKSKRRGRNKVEIDLILEAIVFNLRNICNCQYINKNHIKLSPK